MARPVLIGSTPTRPAGDSAFAVEVLAEARREALRQVQLWVQLGLPVGTQPRLVAVRCLVHGEAQAPMVRAHGYDTHLGVAAPRCALQYKVNGFDRGRCLTPLLPVHGAPWDEMRAAGQTHIEDRPRASRRVTFAAPLPGRGAVVVPFTRSDARQAAERVADPTVAVD